MRVERFCVGVLDTNCYVLHCETTPVSIVIDPGGTSGALLGALKDRDVPLILLTHGHFDHMAGAETLKEATGADICIHPGDSEMLADPVNNGSFMIGAEITAPPADRFLADGETVTFGKSALTVRATPGHSPGGTALFAGNDFVIAGDTLFKGSVGRYDLAGGDYSALMHSLRRVFMTADDAMTVYPGHGEPTTIGDEKRSNPFMR